MDATVVVGAGAADGVVARGAAVVVSSWMDSSLEHADTIRSSAANAGFRRNRILRADCALCAILSTSGYEYGRLVRSAAVAHAVGYSEPLTAVKALVLTAHVLMGRGRQPPASVQPTMLW